jgi:hypothetical protein
MLIIKLGVINTTCCGLQGTNQKNFLILSEFPQLSLLKSQRVIFTVVLFFKLPLL